MSVEIRVPSLGESVTEATVAKWFKGIGEAVTADEPLVELETDKVTLEYNAPASGTLSEIVVEQGGEVEVGALLGAIDEGGAGAKAAKAPVAKEQDQAQPNGGDQQASALSGMSPAVRKLIEESNLDIGKITPSGPKGNITKGDVLAAIEASQGEPSKKAEPAAVPAEKPAPKAEAPKVVSPPAEKPAAKPDRQETGTFAAAIRWRRAGQDDQATPTHRRAAEGSPEHRGNSHHL